jgi:hypothetical protein
MNTYPLFAVTLLTSSLVYANSDSISHLELDATVSPAHNFDLSKWKINLPELETDGSRKGKTVEINKHQLSSTNESYSHPKWFYTDPQTGAMTFVAPNDAPTTPNSSNTRSELRAMLGDKAHSPSNNFAIATHNNAEEFAAIGGQMSATLSVDNVSTSGKYSHNGAFSVVIGQIHGSHNEPLKISYRKLPEHEFGSLVWAYELNPSPEQQDAVDDKGKKLRQDIRHNVFGQFDLRQGDEDPFDGIKLGEVFSYDVNVEGTIMTLTFVKHPNTSKAETKTYQVDLAEGNYQGHEVDLGYGQDWMYYKAGAYNQCNTKASSTACEWRGMDAGDFVTVRFYELELNQ